MPSTTRSMPVCTALLSSPTLWSAPLSALVLTALASLPSHAQDRSVYRCPGNLYTDQITVREAAERGCKTLEGAAVTVVQTRRPEAPKAAASGSPAASGATPARSSGNEGARIDPAEQRARDTDARRILDGELRREEDRLAQLQKDLTNAATASPERQNELRAALARKEADVAAIRRELAKLGASTP